MSQEKKAVLQKEIEAGRQQGGEMMKAERKKPWFDRFLDKHPKFPLWFSVFAVLLSFKKEIVWIINWIASHI